MHPYQGTIRSMLALSGEDRTAALRKLRDEHPDAAVEVEAELARLCVAIGPITQTPSSEPVVYEYVDHPKHYNEHPAGIECIDVIEYMSLNIGTAVKYCWRQGLKPQESNIQDLKKAIWYINREIERLQKPNK